MTKIYKSDTMRPRSKTMHKNVNFNFQEKQEISIANYLFLKNKINLQYLNLGTRGFLTKVFKKTDDGTIRTENRYRTVSAYWWSENPKAAYFWSWKVTVRSGCIIQSMSLLVILGENEQWTAFIKPIGRKFRNK